MSGQNMELSKELEEVELLLKEKKNTKQAKRRFWRVISQIKRTNPNEIDDHVVELASSLRDKLYPRKIILSPPKGAVLITIGFFITLMLFLWVLKTINFGFIINAVILFFALAINLYFTFLLGRCVGSLVSGIKIDGFYMYDPLELGIKMNYRTYLKASQSRRVLLFGTTLIVELTVMLIETYLTFIFKPNYVYVPILLILIWIVGLYVIHKKVKTGEMHRFLRELKILKELKSKRSM